MSETSRQSLEKVYGTAQVAKWVEDGLVIFAGETEEGDARIKATMDGVAATRRRDEEDVRSGEKRSDAFHFMTHDLAVRTDISQKISHELTHGTARIIHPVIAYSKTTAAKRNAERYGIFVADLVPVWLIESEHFWMHQWPHLRKRMSQEYVAECEEKFSYARCSPNRSEQQAEPSSFP